MNVRRQLAAAGEVELRCTSSCRSPGRRATDPPNPRVGRAVLHPCPVDGRSVRWRPRSGHCGSEQAVAQDAEPAGHWPQAEPIGGAPSIGSVYGQCTSVTAGRPVRSAAIAAPINIQSNTTTSAGQSASSSTQSRATSSTNANRVFLSKARTSPTGVRGSQSRSVSVSRRVMSIVGKRPAERTNSAPVRCTRSRAARCARTRTSWPRSTSRASPRAAEARCR